MTPTVEEMIALAQLPMDPNGVGLRAWKQGWVPCQGNFHKVLHPGCTETLWTHLPADESRIYYLHGEGIHADWALPGAFEDANGIAWIESGSDVLPWLRQLLLTTEAT